MSRAPSRRMALALLTTARMPWRHATEKDAVGSRYNGPVYPHSWSGQELLVTEQRVGSDLIHELCHWLVAPKNRRNAREFGLGDPSWPDVVFQGERLLRSGSSNNEEATVAVLDAYIHYILGRRWCSRALALYLVFDHVKTWNALLDGDAYEDNSNRRLWRTLVRRGLTRRVRGIIQRVS